MSRLKYQGPRRSGLRRKGILCVHYVSQCKKVLLDFLVTVKAAPHECVIRTGQP